MSSAALLAGAEVLKQECTAISPDYAQNPTLIRTLAASIVTCLKTVTAREPDEDVFRTAATALEASRRLSERSVGEERKVVQAGLVTESLVVLHKLESGGYRQCCRI